MQKRQSDAADLVPLNTKVPADLVETLDELRRGEKDLPNRSEMVRRLIERAGEARGLKGKRK